MYTTAFGVGCAAVFTLLLVSGAYRIGRATASVRTSLREAGYEVVQLQRRLWRWGPYGWTTNQHSQFVYRVVVRTPDGRPRQGWARWGRPWLWMADTLELRWDDERA